MINCFYCNKEIEEILIMLHIVFSEADIQTLHKAMELDTSLAGEVWQIKDDFAAGPLLNIYETEGYQQRRDWWKMLLHYSSQEAQLYIVDDKLMVHNIIKKIAEKEIIWIWIGQNAHDVCGYYWLISQLSDCVGKVFILNLANLPFINEKGNLFYPNYLHEIQPREFSKAKKLARPIAASEFEMDSDEWKKICTENAIVRILEGGKKISSKEASYYDEAIFSVLQKEPQKLTKYLHHILLKNKSACR